MNFTLNRDLVVPSTLGHSIEFKKGKPVHVPRAMRSAVLAVGAVPEEEIVEDDAVEQKAAPETDERRELILSAFDQLVLTNKREDFTGNGVPTAGAIAALTGFKVDSKERDTLWAEFQRAQA
jgi:hypothetical protein